MWDNPRALNVAAGALVGVASLGLAGAALGLVLRTPLFPLAEVVLAQPVERTTRDEIAAAIEQRIGGNFFAVNPSEVRAGLEQLPWVRRASVRRVWPGRLEIALEEHVAFARWGDDALINTYGERFTARSDARLPLLIGPDGAEAEMVRRYGSFSAALAPLGEIERLVLTPRHAWQVRLASGLHVMLGRDAGVAEARLRRFAQAYPATLGRIARRHDYVDLRYPNGFALRVPELRG
ncbi:MAG TPA: cell division protein FtsQ/DivIB [Burkholderiales bacterium]|nr:cell division protein FtsQ/DivIB [Burkholderiales bacterium]